jgi:hypothetical protein
MRLAMVVDDLMAESHLSRLSRKANGASIATIFPKSPGT